jgi:O-antigen/teichoic acid export membrane protein
MTIRQIYLRSGLFSLAGKLVTSFAALGVIWLITRIAGKDIFGEIMIAYAFNFVIAAALAAQFQTILLYHVSRGGEHRDKLGSSLFFALMIGFILVLAEKFCATPLASLMNKPQLSEWFSSLSWMIPAFAVNSILCAWYRARQDIPTMVMYFEVWPNILRLLFLCVILFTLHDPAWIATAYTFSYVLSFFILYTRDPIPLNANPRAFTWWDMRYSAQMMIGHMMSKSLSNIVVFFLGIFASAAVVADYVLAMKFAQFLNLPKLILSQVQMPRMGAQIETRESIAMMEEYEAVRSLSLAATILGTAFFILLLPYIFVWFGDFASAVNLFLILAISAIILAGFGSAGSYLGIAGHAGTAIIVHAASLAVLMVSLLVLVPLYGGEGASMATGIGSLTLMAATAFAVKRRDHLTTMTMSASLQIIWASLVLALAAAGIFSGPAAALLLILIAALGLLEARPALKLLLPF